MLVVGCRCPLSGLESILLFLVCLEFLSWILTSAFSLSVEMIIFCVFINVVNYINFWIISQLVISVINSTWSWFIILFIYCLSLFANTLLGFVYFVHEGYWFATFCIFVFFPNSCMFCTKRYHFTNKLNFLMYLSSFLDFILYSVPLIFVFPISLLLMDALLEI